MRSCARARSASIVTGAAAAGWAADCCAAGVVGLPRRIRIATAAAASLTLRMALLSDAGMLAWANGRASQAPMWGKRTSPVKLLASLAPIALCALVAPAPAAPVAPSAPAAPVAQFDHLVVAVRSLDEGVAEF